MDRFPVFSSIPTESDRGLSWVPVPDFSVADHVRVVDLPTPTSLGDVQRFVAAQRSRPFDRTRPLWEFLCVDHVTTPDGADGAVMMCRLHHSIADGVRLVQVILGLCDPVDGDAAVEATVGGVAAAIPTPPAADRSTLRQRSPGTPPAPSRLPPPGPSAPSRVRWRPRPPPVSTSRAGRRRRSPAPSPTPAARSRRCPGASPPFLVRRSRLREPCSARDRTPWTTGSVC